MIWRRSAYPRRSRYRARHTQVPGYFSIRSSNYDNSQKTVILYIYGPRIFHR